MDLLMGTHPLFETIKMARRRLGEKPYISGGGCPFSGFISAYWKRLPRQVPDEFMAYLRKEQMGKNSSDFPGAQKGR